MRTPVPAPVVPKAFPWPWLLGVAALGLLALLWARYRRDALPRHEETSEPGPDAEVEAVAAPPVRRTGAPWLTVTVRPVRAGLNMVTAVADCEITVANEGGAPAEQVRTALTLLAAHAGQQVEIDAASAEPITRSVVTPFTLAAGEARTFRGVASASLHGLPTMRAGGRDMLVPLVLVNVQYRELTGVEQRVSQGFVVGVERVDSPKLAPFWIDSIRMIDQVAARPSGAPERRRIAP